MWTFITALTLSLGTASADQIEMYTGSGTDLQAVPSTQGGSPEFYLVAPGDTLWEIAQAFLGNPYYWPRLWSINDYITNPHWIYPGNRIVFRMGSLIEPPSVELETDRDGFSVDGLDFAEVKSNADPTFGSATRLMPTNTSHRRSFDGRKTWKSLARSQKHAHPPSCLQKTTWYT